MPRKLTQQEFIERAEKLHEGRYDYSKAIYRLSTAKITIVCPDHGPFEQMPSMHLTGQGCPYCGGSLPLTRESFIKRSEDKHGKRYDYSKIREGVRSDHQVSVGCPVHGFFLQNAKHHMDGHGCKSCGATVRGRCHHLQLPDFIKRATYKFAGKYSYESVKLDQGAATTIRLTCQQHGTFDVKASDHLRGRGCLLCGEGRKHTTKSFVVRARDLHGDLYNYSLVDYLNANSPVQLICHEHGVFTMTPAQHLAGRICPDCSAQQRGQVRRLTLEIFLQRAEKQHGKRYDYSGIQEFDSQGYLPIVCSEHGLFHQQPFPHLKGSGCPECGRLQANESISKAKTFSQQDFIDRAIAKHGATYDYSQAVYLGYHEPIQIRCSRHGSFLQKPAEHLSGSGCPKCSSSRGERSVAQVLEILGFHAIHQWTNHDLKASRRLAFDFFIPEVQLAIEIDGEQHYHPVAFGSRDVIKVQLIHDGIRTRDRMKSEWCREQGVALLRIPYWLVDDHDYLIERLAQAEGATEMFVDPDPGEGWNVPP